MADTYDIDKQRHEVLLAYRNGQLAQDDLIRYFAQASLGASEYKKMEECLMESIQELLVPEDVAEVLRTMENKMADYDYRFADEEDIAALEAYGYTGPILPVDFEDALQYMDHGHPVFLLHPDNTQTTAENGLEVERHLKDGGMAGVTMFAAEDLAKQMAKETLGEKDLSED